MDKDTKEIVKKALSEHLGIDPEDINDEDSFEHDLHMRASDVSDLIEILNSENIDTGKVDLMEIETVSDLVNALNGESDID